MKKNRFQNLSARLIALILTVMTSTGKYFFSNTASFTSARVQSQTEKMNAFLKDSRWKNGTAWGARRPKLSTYSSTGCCAYCADFVKYVYGSNNLVSGSRFTNVSAIKGFNDGKKFRYGSHYA